MITTGRKKILWVVFDFVQAGGQRYVFEICKALNKEKYDIDILKVMPMDHDKNWGDEFYFEPTLALGCRIIFLADLFSQKVKMKKTFKPSFSEKVLSKLKGSVYAESNGATDFSLETEILTNFFSQYDHVNFSGTAIYKSICIDRNIHPANGIVHILTARFQDSGMYDGYDEKLTYNFVSPIILESLQDELQEIKNYKYTHYPMCFETSAFEVDERVFDGRYRIAVFTRLSPMKPLDPYFYALKLLVEQNVNVELCIYGAGDPKQLGLIRQLEYMYISDRVKFMGHTESIPQTLKTGNIDLVWFQSGNRQPAGYAAFEISMSGLPQVFWDFMDIGKRHGIEEVFASFTSLSDFVTYTKKLLVSPDLRKQIGFKQREYVIEHYSSKNYIHILEQLFDK